MKMKEMVKNLIAKVKENKIKSGIITGLLVMTLVGGTATAMLMSDNTAKADNNKTTTVAKTVKKDDVKKSNSKKVEKEIKENKESKPEEVKEAEKKLEEAKKSGNVEAIKEAEKLVETKKSAVKATANSTSKQTAPASKQTASTSKQTASNSSNNSSKSSTEVSKPATPQKKKVWVVTKPAWDEQVPDYNLPIYKEVEVCRFYNGAGQLIYTIIDNSEDVNAKYKELAKTVNGLSLEEGYEDVPTGQYQTKTVHHEAEGEYVWQ